MAAITPAAITPATAANDDAVLAAAAAPPVPAPETKGAEGASTAEGGGAIRERQEAVWKAEAALASKEAALGEASTRREAGLREREQKLQKAEEALAAREAAVEESEHGAGGEGEEGVPAAAALAARRSVVLRMGAGVPALLATVDRPRGSNPPRAPRCHHAPTLTGP